MGVARKAYIVLGVEGQIVLDEALGSILLALVGKLLGALAEVVVNHVLHIALPAGINLAGIAGGDSLQIGLHGREEVGEVEEGVTVVGDGIRHACALGDKAVAVHAEDSVVEASALAEAGVTVGTHVAVGTVHIGLAYEEAFAKVDVGHLGMLLQHFALEESKAGVSPARTAVLLVLDAGHGIFNHCGENKRVLGQFLLLGLGSHCASCSNHGCKTDKENFLHSVCYG